MSGKCEASANIAEEDSATAIHQNHRPKRSRRTKLCKRAAGICFFIVFHALLLVGIGSILPVRKPKYRIQSVVIRDLYVSDDVSSPFLSMKMGALVSLKNSNFGIYKFRGANLTFYYKGTDIGKAAFPNSHVPIRAKKRTWMAVNLSTRDVPKGLNLSRDIAYGALPLSARSELRGKVEYLKVIKRLKYASLNCTLSVNLLGKVLQKLKCD